MRLSLAFFLALVAVVAAAESASCGVNHYSSAAIAAAADAACSRVKKGTVVGGNMYPHRYKNYENFRLNGLSGPFYEFPIMHNGQVFFGGNPGPDRIILTKDCTMAGILTHQGATNNAFRECTIKVTSSASAVVADTRFVLAVSLALMALAFAA
ncbi:hypothetical protein E4U42_007206 [Claviceps africana]|uniref:ribonuclease T1 n=1 Tax=Claviceps africana TaxID=83212 RepID=A0A8K0NIQ6_9HYPO|nr:hypothetical protein E4U42_007206 [Claviceps africana]